MRIRNRPFHTSLPTNASPPPKPAVAGRPELALGRAAMAAGGGKEDNLGSYLTQIGLVRRRRRRAAGGSSPQPAAESMGSGVVDQGAAAGKGEDWEDRGSRLPVEEENDISRIRKVEEPLVKKKKQSTQEDDEELLASMWSKTKMKKRKTDAGRELPHEKNEDLAIETKQKRRMCKGSSKSSNQSKVGLVIEGSRCSRINGRGWRCSQQTLVGYSLCEHHLGKGRLKSMSSLPGRHSARKSMNMLSSDDIDEQDQPLMEAKKSMQDRKSCSTIGLEKARTVGSLLNVVAGHDDHSSAMLPIDASACQDGSIGTVPGDDAIC